MENLKAIMKNKCSENLDTAVRSVSGKRKTGPGVKMRLTRSGSIREPISKYLFGEDTNSETNPNTDRKEDFEQPEIQLIKSRTQCEVGENPFLKIRQSYGEKEKQRSLKNIKNHS
jgi:hypothetical protein